MDAATKDNIATTSAVGLLAYASADIGHHVFGHGAACIALDGQINLLTSIYVDCTLRGSTIDLAGPFANLIVGIVAMLVTRMSRISSTTRLFYVLAAAFNLFWFSMQLAFSATTRTDDWAWAMIEFHINAPVRYGMIAIGVIGYYWLMRYVAMQLNCFATPPSRLKVITRTAWLTAGALACVTAIFDHHVIATLRQAIPQSLALSIGLLLVPGIATKAASPVTQSNTITLSWRWIITSMIIGVTSIVLLGPGISTALVTTTTSSR